MKQNSKIYTNPPDAGQLVVIEFADGLKLKGWYLGLGLKRALGLRDCAELDVTVILPDDAAIADRPFMERAAELDSIAKSLVAKPWLPA